MKADHRLLILNNCPAFYKINLYNKIFEKRDIFVVFFGTSNQVVEPENIDDAAQFPFVILNNFQVEKRNRLKTFFKILKIVQKLRPQRIIYGGYIMPDMIALSYLQDRRKNILQTESASESKMSGMAFFLKKLILKRFDKAIASGSTHAGVLEKMGFKNEILVSKGVGIIHHTKKLRETNNDVEGNWRFLFVGRLIDVKNLEKLIDVFNQNELPLTIVGNGPLMDKLRGKAEKNIVFTGYVENAALDGIYGSHHFFILPSLSEAWGLVVEEALAKGCVPLVSERVGCAQELVVQPQTGCTFDPLNSDSMQNAINMAILNYDTLLSRVANFDLESKDKEQVNAYLQL